MMRAQFEGHLTCVFRFAACAVDIDDMDLNLPGDDEEDTQNTQPQV